MSKLSYEAARELDAAMRNLARPRLFGYAFFILFVAVAVGLICYIEPSIHPAAGFIGFFPLTIFACFYMDKGLDAQEERDNNPLSAQFLSRLSPSTRQELDMLRSQLFRGLLRRNEVLKAITGAYKDHAQAAAYDSQQ